MEFSTFEEFVAVHPAAAAQEAKALDALDLAGDLVQRFAPVPEGDDPEYASRAARAERFVASYIFNTWGGVSSQSVGDLRRSFSNDTVLRDLIRDTMGAYAPARRIRSQHMTRG